jgi:sporulation protein YlmC with PRC-barrel domain
MQLWLKDIKGMWVATLQEGRMLGTVSSLYMDPQSKRVSGLLVRTGTPLAGEDRWVAVAGIQKIGEDLIFLESASQANSQAPLGKRVADLLGKTVCTHEGKALGPLTDIEVDSTTWVVSELTVGGLQSVPVDLEQTVFGDDLILLQPGAEAELAASAKKREGLLDTVLGDPLVQQASDTLKRWLRGSEAQIPSSREARQSPAQAPEAQGEEPPAAPDEPKDPL